MSNWPPEQDDPHLNAHFSWSPSWRWALRMSKGGCAITWGMYRDQERETTRLVDHLGARRRDGCAQINVVVGYCEAFSSGYERSLRAALIG